VHLGGNGRQTLEGDIKLQYSPPAFTKIGNWRDGGVLEDPFNEKRSKLIRGPASFNDISALLPVDHAGEASFEEFSSSRPLIDSTSLMQCKHCRKSRLKAGSRYHIDRCLLNKKFKAQRKKEAREARERAKEAAKEKQVSRLDDADDDKVDDDSEVEDDGKKVTSGVKSMRKASAKKPEFLKGKKRKADIDVDQGPRNKKKKDDPKPKTVKPKGPVDVERQCGVLLPNGQPCARSLTCKSHSMGAKRAVVGRSLPYDMLLAAYQKKNQAKQQKAALDANAPIDDEEDAHGGPIDSDEETAAVMGALAQWNPQPVVPQPTFDPIRSQYHAAQLHESLQLATNGGRINIFKVATSAVHREPIERHLLSTHNLETLETSDLTSSLAPMKKGPFDHDLAPPRPPSLMGQA
jgi:SAGA-associated factor 73